MDVEKSIEKTKAEFELSFAEKNYYDLQTKDENHLELILNCLKIKDGNTVLDLGTGSGYLAFEIASRHLFIT